MCQPRAAVGWRAPNPGHAPGAGPARSGRGQFGERLTRLLAERAAEPSAGAAAAEPAGTRRARHGLGVHVRRGGPAVQRQPLRVEPDGVRAAEMVRGAASSLPPGAADVVRAAGRVPGEGRAPEAAAPVGLTLSRHFALNSRGCWARGQTPAACGCCLTARDARGAGRGVTARDARSSERAAPARLRTGHRVLAGRGFEPDL